ncbi:MAG: hypothetical protein FWF01_00835 [Alphaproteobacteria bacterium]|nr:hypothetical protein [Alphaproteobacteria bacterium]
MTAIGNHIAVKNNFIAGELAPELFGRGDLKIYESGARLLENVIVLPTGGAMRRDGLRMVEKVDKTGRLIEFAFNTEQVYLMFFTDGEIFIYKDDVRVARLETPWTAAQIPHIRWTQNADTLIVSHKDVPLQEITRSSDEEWSIAPLVFDTEEVHGYLTQPYYNFMKSPVKVSASGKTGRITLTADTAVFTEDYVGLHMRIHKGEVLVESVGQNGTALTGQVKVALEDNQPTALWQEPAFSPIRGWPMSVTHHQSRLVIGGSRDLPNRLWISKSGEPRNFDVGIGLDDEAIDFTILSDQVNAIYAVVSSRHLQIFTSGAEWMVSGEPLTPSSIQLKRQTLIGSIGEWYMPPRSIDGATMFAAANKNELREFMFGDIEQAYQSRDLSMLSQHLVDSPVDQSYDPKRRVLYVVMQPGHIAAVTNYRAESITAWTRFTTQGRFLSIASAGDKTYVLVDRGNLGMFLERFDQILNTDCAAAGNPLEIDLSHLYKEFVAVKGREDWLTGRLGDIPLKFDGSGGNIEAGLPFKHEIVPLPVAADIGGSPVFPRAIRLVKARFRVIGTKLLQVDVGQGARHAILPSFNQALRGQQPYSGDVTVHALGWARQAMQPLWRVVGSDPFDMLLTNVTMEVKAML